MKLLKARSVLGSILLFATCVCGCMDSAVAQASLAKPAAAPAPAASSDNQAEIQRLTGINNQLLGLMKQLQDLLEESEHQRKEQSSFIAKLEEKLVQAEADKAALQKELEHHTSGPGSDTQTETAEDPNPPRESVTKVRDLPAPTKPPSALPLASDAPPGEMAWRRILQLKGTDGLKTQVFHVFGNRWRVLWHNQDPPGEKFANTSALFIHAFPRDDTVPQEVCAKCGTDGGSTDLRGPGNYYLVVEASGGLWELAVEDLKNNP